MKSSIELADDLTAFTGTAHWFRYPLNRNITFTDGAAYFAENAGAYWLFDIVVTQPEIIRTMRDGFAVIKLQVHPDSKAILICEDGNLNTTYTRAIDFTDCPVGLWTLWFVDYVILLPSEY